MKSSTEIPNCWATVKQLSPACATYHHVHWSTVPECVGAGGMAVGPQIDVDGPAVAVTGPDVRLLFAEVVLRDSNESEMLEPDVRVANAVVGDSVVEELDTSVALALASEVEFNTPVLSRLDFELRNSVVDAFCDLENPTEAEVFSVLFKLPVVVIEFVVVVVGSRLCVIARVVYKIGATDVSITSVVLACPDP